MRKTIGRSVSVSGLGLHSGCSVSVELLPGGPGDGIRFVRRGDGESFEALASSVISTERRTVIGTGGFSVSTVEHFMSAAYSLGITDLRVLIDAPEMPVLDGSAASWCNLFGAAGFVDLPGDRRIVSVPEPLAVTSGGAVVVASPSDRLSFTYILDYPGTFLGTQACCFVPSSGDYERDIAPARTFGFYSEMEYIKRNNLAKGCDLSNALVIMDDGYSSELKVPCEPARHKCLDLIGDIALCGCDLRASITAFKSGHSLNTEMAALLQKLGGS